MYANDNFFPDHEDRVRALDLLRRVAGKGDPRLAIDPREEPTLARRLESVLRILEILDLAVVRRASDGRPLRLAMTENGISIGSGLVGGGVALFPAEGGVRIVRPPASKRRSGSRLPARAPALILATAPSHYDAAVVRGSETEVIIDPVAQWDRHPTLTSHSCSIEGIRRAWEVFSTEGQSYGLVLETGGGFDGVDARGGHNTEDTLSGAAWQVRVNC